jgi:hypothetical protein
VSPIPTQEINATTNFYGIKRDLLRTTNGRNKIYALWTPPISLFDSEEIKMGSAFDYKISLTPNPNYRVSAVETRNPSFMDNATYQLNILDVKLYIYTVKMSIPDQISTYDLLDCHVQSQIHQYSLQYTVPSNTLAITIFVQSEKAGKDARIPPSMFKCDRDTDLNLESLQVSYNGITKSSTPWSSNFENNIGGRNVNLMYQRYRDSLNELDMNIDSLGCETFEDWLQRGGFYHFSFGKDSMARNTQLQILSKFSPALEPSSKMFVVSWYKRSIQITTNKGMIVDVQTIQAAM